jgi:hypothetical protein
MTGRERREERRRERQRLRWIRENLLLVGAGALTAALVGLALILAVFGGDGDEEPPVVALPSPTVPPTDVVEDSGPPPAPSEPTFSDSGLGIIDIETGTGETPEAGQTLIVHYTGWVSEGGTKFDSSLDRGTPFEFVLGAGQVIAGWDEGLATMKVGGKRRLIMPAELAYGEQGSPPTIQPNAELTFDVELVGIKEAP